VLACSRRKGLLIFYGWMRLDACIGWIMRSGTGGQNAGSGDNQNSFHLFVVDESKVGQAVTSAFR